MRAARQTLDKLKSLESQLRAQGIDALYLFGSVARGDNTENSDIDLTFDIVPGRRLSLFDQARLTRELGDALHAKVDFTPRNELHPYIRASVEGEQVKVFG